MKQIDRKVESEVLEGDLVRALEENPGADFRRFVAAGLSIIPKAGGAIGKLVVAGDEKRRRDQLELLLRIASNRTARFKEVEDRVAVLMDQEHLFALKVVLETGGTIAIAAGYGVSSITDDGNLDFTINFTERVWPYTFDIFGSGQVEIARSVPTEQSLRIQLAKAAPARVAVVILRG